MKPVLIVGATGQLGTAALRRLVAAGRPVRAFVRRGSACETLRGEKVELAFGDLRDSASVAAACRGVDVVLATANAVVPRGSYGFDETEGSGYRALIAGCRAAGVRRFVFMSVPVLPGEEDVPTFRWKRRIERMLAESGLVCTVFRGSLFMDDWFALMGSSIPLRGAEAATLRRPFWFSRAFLAGVGNLIEKRGIALVPGDGRTRHAFIALDEVADYLAAGAMSEDGGGTYDIGGPDVLSWLDVVGLFAKVLGRRVRAMRVPVGVYRAFDAVLAPLSPAAANLMGLTWLTARSGTNYDTRETARRFGVTSASAEDFLRRKAALPEVA